MTERLFQGGKLWALVLSYVMAIKFLMDSKFHGEQRIIRNLACMQLKEVIIKNNLTDMQTVFVIFEVCKYERTSPYIVFRCHAMLNSLTSPP